MCDIKLSNDKYNFRYRVAAIIVEGDEVLLAGADFNGNYTYYSVGGAVHTGELAHDAVVREVFEETGVSYKIERLAVIHENLYNGFCLDTVGKTCHEIALYFLMKSRGSKILNMKNSINSSGCSEKMHWLKINTLDELHAYPTFLKTYLNNPKEDLVHIITDNRDK